MPSPGDVVGQAWHKLRRDRDAPLSVLARKGASYALGVASAPVWLHSAQRGRGLRTTGRPRIENFGRMIIGDYVIIRSVPLPVELTTSVGAVLEIGDDTFINYAASIGATGEVRIGRRVEIGPFVMVIDTTYHSDYDRSQVPPPQPVLIGDDVFLGAKCSVMPGVTIGDGAVVGTGAVVTHDVAPFTVVAGVPAREIKKLDPAKFVRARR
jgi:acetyltransferase-like isoleucine patch superfamily enzyme